MTALGIAEYDRSEEDAVTRLPNRVVEAFQRMRLSASGYPLRIRREEEVLKYIDALHESRGDHYFAELLGRITPREFDILQNVIAVYLDFTEQQLGEMRVPRASMLHALNTLRHIKYLFGDAKPRVFEIGTGADVLGTMLLLEQYPCAALHTTQALYVLQNRLWDFVAKGNVIDGVNRKDAVRQLERLQAGQPVHIPWWEFCSLKPESAPRVDVVTASRCLCEWNELGLRCVAQLAHAMLAGERFERKVLLFQGWGSGDVAERARVTQCLYEVGFRLAHSDERIVVFATKASVAAETSRTLPDPASGWNPGEFSPASSALSSAIQLARNDTEDERVVGPDQLATLLTALFGREELSSPDEQFCARLGVTPVPEMKHL